MKWTVTINALLREEELGSCSLDTILFYTPVRSGHEVRHERFMDSWSLRLFTHLTM